MVDSADFASFRLQSQPQSAAEARCYWRHESPDFSPFSSFRCFVLIISQAYGDNPPEPRPLCFPKRAGKAEPDRAAASSHKARNST
ncbi:hypothetical protein SRHO_G00310280 [Serrasalmus rhombeus]